MSQELTKGYCTDCQSNIRPERDSNNYLKLSCGCHDRHIKIERACPQEWDL